MGGLVNVLISRHSGTSVNYYGAMPRRRLLTALPDITLICSVLVAVAFDVFIPLVILYSAMWLKVLACGAIAVLIVLGVGILRNLRSAGCSWCSDHYWVLFAFAEPVLPGVPTPAGCCGVCAG